VFRLGLRLRAEPEFPFPPSAPKDSSVKQSELNRAVADSLGESVRTIADRGFSLLSDTFDEREPLVLDFEDPDCPTALPLAESAC
jgi:hypothetical protein